MLSHKMCGEKAEDKVEIRVDFSCLKVVPNSLKWQPTQVGLNHELPIVSASL